MLSLRDYSQYVSRVKCPTEIRCRYREPKPIPNFGIGIGAVTFSAETEIAVIALFSKDTACHMLLTESIIMDR